MKFIRPIFYTLGMALQSVTLQTAGVTGWRYWVVCIVTIALVLLAQSEKYDLED